MKLGLWSKVAMVVGLMLLVGALSLTAACSPAEPEVEPPPPEAEVSEFDTVQAAIEKYQPCGKAWHIKAEDVFLLLNDDDEDNDPFIVSVRAPEDYAKGHLPGAVNIGCGALLTKESLAKLDADRQIVVYCYTGQTGSQATSLLNMLGYDAINLKFGMAGWTSDTDVAPKAFNNETDCMDYELER